MSFVPGIDPLPIRVRHLRKQTLAILIIGIAGSGVLVTLLVGAVFDARNAARASTVL